jgi:hypothetical protein
MKPPKLLIRIGLVVLIVAAAVLVVRGLFNYAEGRQLTRTVADLKAKGTPVTAEALAGPCSDEDNAARLWKAVENVFEDQVGRGPGLPPRPSPTAWQSFSRAWQAFSDGKPIAPADRSDMKELILKNRKAFELLAEMGRKPCFRYRGPGETRLESRQPSALQMIRITKLLLLSALFSAEEGDFETAVGKLRTGLRFAPLVAREGGLISYLIAVADTRMLAFFSGDLLRGRPVRDEDLLGLIAELDPGPWPGRLAAAARGERVVFIEAGDYVLRGNAKDVEFLYGEHSFLKKIGAWLIRPLLKRDIREALPVYDELEAQAQRPYYESRTFFGSRGRDLMARPWYAFFSKAMLASFDTTFMKGAMVEAVLTAARTGLACRLFKSRTGRYPEGLSELVPDILSEVPIDPFTGKPLVYRRDGEGFIVYSLGSNQKDDGGRSTFMITQLVMPKDDDWTWREER